MKQYQISGFPRCSGKSIAMQNILSDITSEIISKFQKK